MNKQQIDKLLMILESFEHKTNVAIALLPKHF